MEAICYFNKEYFLSELQRAGVIKNDEENDAHSLTLEKVPNVTIGLVLAVRSLKQFENQIILNWIRKGKEVTSLIDDQFALYDKLSIYLQSNVYSEDDIEKWKQILNETKYVFPESKSRGWAQIFGDTPILLDSDDSHESNIDLEGTELTVESPIRSENDRNNEYLEMTMASKEINESKANRPHFSKHSNFLSDDICEDDICDMDNSLDFECSIDSNNEIPEMRENDMLNLSVKDELVESQKAEIWTLKVSEQKAGIWTFKVSEPPSVPEKEKEKKKKKKKENITPNLKEYFNSGSLVEIKKNCSHNNLLCTLCSVISGDKDMPQHLAGKRHRAENEFTWKDKRRAKKVMENHAMTGYFLYLNETREQIKMDNPGITVKEIPRRAGELWNAIEDKSKWLKLEKSVQEESAYALVEKKAGGSGDNIVVDVPKNASIAEEAVTKMSGPVEVDCITLSDSEDDDPSSEPKKTNIGQGPVFSASIAAANTLASAHIPSERDNTHETDGNEKSYNDSDDERKFKRSKFEQEHSISNSDSSYSPVQEERKVKRKKIVHKRMLSSKDSSDSSIQERKMKRQKSVRKHFISSIDSSDSPGQDVDPDSDDGSGNSGNDSDDERNSKRSRFESNCFVSSGKEMLDWLNDSEKSSNDSDDEIKSKRSKFAREHFISSDPDSSYSPGQEERKVNTTKFVHKHMLSSTDSSDSPGQDVVSDSDDASDNSGYDLDDEGRKSKQSRFESDCFVSSGKEMLDWLNVIGKFGNASNDKGRKSKRSKFKIENFILPRKDSSNSPGKGNESNYDGTGRSHKGTSKKRSPVHGVRSYELAFRQHQHPVLQLEQALTSTSWEEEQKRDTREAGEGKAETTSPAESVYKARGKLNTTATAKAIYKAEVGKISGSTEGLLAPNSVFRNCEICKIDFINETIHLASRSHLRNAAKKLIMELKLKREDCLQLCSSGKIKCLWCNVMLHIPEMQKHLITLKHRDKAPTNNSTVGNLGVRTREAEVGKCNDAPPEQAILEAKRKVDTISPAEAVNKAEAGKINASAEVFIAPNSECQRETIHLVSAYHTMDSTSETLVQTIMKGEDCLLRHQSGNLKCLWCNISLGHPINLNFHLDGNEHRFRAATIAGVVKKLIKEGCIRQFLSGEIICLWCNITISIPELPQHLASLSHRKNGTCNNSAAGVDKRSPRGNLRSRSSVHGRRRWIRDESSSRQDQLPSLPAPAPPQQHRLFSQPPPIIPHQLSLPPTAPPLQNQLFSQPPPPLPHQHPSPPPPPPPALQHQLPLLSPPPQALASSRIADSFREMTQSQNNVNQVSPNNESLLCEVANKVAKHTLYKDTAYIIAQITTELENTGIPPTLEIIGILSLKISEQHKMEALLYEVAEKVAKVALNKDTDYIISQITTELENSGIPTTLEIIGKIVLEISDHHKRNTMEGNLC